MGAPLFKVRDIVEANDVAAFSSNYQLYGDLSLRLLEAFQEFTPDVEVYSIDEAFLGLEPRPGQSFRDYGLEIKAKVYKWTGVPCSMGISQTKTLSKVAQRFTKKNPETRGVLDLTDPSRQTSVLEETPVGDVWGVRPAYSKLLKGAGITTARKLRDADRRWVRQRMTVVGARIVEELRGVSCLPLERCPQARKSVTCSRSFGVLVESLEELREAVAVYTTRAAERLRRSRLAAGVVTVFISTNRFGADPQYSNAETFELTCSTDSTEGAAGVGAQSPGMDLPPRIQVQEGGRDAERAVAGGGRDQRQVRSRHDSLRRGAPRRSVGDEVSATVAALHDLPKRGSPRRLRCKSQILTLKTARLCRYLSDDTPYLFREDEGILRNSNPGTRRLE